MNEFASRCVCLIFGNYQVERPGRQLEMWTWLRGRCSICRRVPLVEAPAREVGTQGCGVRLCAPCRNGDLGSFGSLKKFLYLCVFLRGDGGMQGLLF